MKNNKKKKKTKLLTSIDQKNDNADKYNAEKNVFLFTQDYQPRKDENMLPINEAEYDGHATLEGLSPDYAPERIFEKRKTRAPIKKG